jgi:PPE-repeat protein
MSWAASPPEVISGQIYAGAGAGPLLAAATALTNLATTLGTTAAGWESTIMTLTASPQWQGTGAAAAAAAAQTFITWLTTTETEVSQAAAQATASAAAFTAAHTAVVNPAAILANRTAYAAAVAGLPFTAATVATLEAAYDTMWATDVAAMGVYQAASAAAGVVPPVVEVTGAINPAANSPAAAAAPAAATLGSGDLITSLDGLIGTPAVSNAINGAVNTAAWFVMNTIPTAVSLGHTFAGAAVPAAAVSDVVPAGAGGVMEGTVVSSVTPMGGLGGLAGAGASASVGQAATVGKLSVPATWAATTQAETSLASSVAPLEGSGWTAATEAAQPVSAMPGMPGAAAAAKGAGAYGGPRYGFKPIVMPKQVVV